MFKSATLKLTLWYVLIIMMLSLVFSFVLYHLSSTELNEGLISQSRMLNSDDHDSDDRVRAIDNDESQLRLNNLKVNLVYFNITVLLGSTVVSYILARRTLKPIERSHRYQTRFNAEASHELRTPLTAMRSDTEVTLMDKHADSKVLRSTLRANLKDIGRLEELAGRLLDISRYESGAKFNRNATDLKLLVAESLDQFKGRIKDKKLKIESHLEDVKVFGDPYALKQLAVIVLDNAVKYSDKNGRITINLSINNRNAELVVDDQGMKIAEEDLKHIFERFYRSKNILKDGEHEGHGLGLSLAKEIVISHGGSISIKNIEKGVRVSVSLPVDIE